MPSISFPTSFTFTEYKKRLKETAYTIGMSLPVLVRFFMGDETAEGIAKGEELFNRGKSSGIDESDYNLIQALPHLNPLVESTAYSYLVASRLEANMIKTLAHTISSANGAVTNGFNTSQGPLASVTQSKYTMAYHNLILKPLDSGIITGEGVTDTQFSKTPAGSMKAMQDYFNNC